MGPSRSCWDGTTSRRRLLRRGLEFHVCTINKSVYPKKSGNLFADPHTQVRILKNDNRETLKNFEIKTNHQILARRSDLVFINKKKKRTLH